MIILNILPCHVQQNYLKKSICTYNSMKFGQRIRNLSSFIINNEKRKCNNNNKSTYILLISSCNNCFLMVIICLHLSYTKTLLFLHRSCDVTVYDTKYTTFVQTRWMLRYLHWLSICLVIKFVCITLFIVTNIRK